MNTLIFRTVAPVITSLMLLFSVFVLLRGHNEPGGGFIGGLIAVSALAVYGIAFGWKPCAVPSSFTRCPLPVSACCWRRLRHALGLFGVPFMTGLWVTPALRA